MIPDPENSSVSSARAALGGYHRGTGLTWVSTVSTLRTGCHHLGYSISLQATFAWVYPASCILTSVRLLYKQLQRSTLGTRTVTLPIKLEVGSRSRDKRLVVNVLGFLYYSDLQESPTYLKWCLYLNLLLSLLLWKKTPIISEVFVNSWQISFERKKSRRPRVLLVVSKKEIERDGCMLGKNTSTDPYISMWRKLQASWTSPLYAVSGGSERVTSPIGDSQWFLVLKGLELI